MCPSYAEDDTSLTKQLSNNYLLAEMNGSIDWRWNSRYDANTWNRLSSMLDMAAKRHNGTGHERFVVHLDVTDVLAGPVIKRMMRCTLANQDFTCFWKVQSIGIWPSGNRRFALNLHRVPRPEGLL